MKCPTDVLDGAPYEFSVIRSESRHLKLRSWDIFDICVKDYMILLQL